MKFIFVIDNEIEDDCGDDTDHRCSYAWITSKEFFDENGCFDDTFRTDSVTKYLPDFDGFDDMASHFIFYGKTKEQLREYLVGLHFSEVETPKWLRSN